MQRSTPQQARTLILEEMQQREGTLMTPPRPPALSSCSARRSDPTFVKSLAANCRERFPSAGQTPASKSCATTTGTGGGHVEADPPGER
jgi:hypothetical protein